MQTTAFAVPIPSGQMAALRELTAWMSNERNEPALRVRRQAGLDREQIFLQHTPAGDVAIIVWDTPNPARVFASFAYDESDFGLYFRHKLLEIHEGYLEALQNLPVPTVLSDWQSPGWSLERFQPAAFCFPVPAGQVSAGNRWTASLAPGGSNRDKYVDVCRTFGIERQLFSVQSMPEGEIAVMYGEGRPDWFPNAFQTMAMSDDSVLAKWRDGINSIAAAPVFGDDATPPRVEQLLHLVMNEPATISRT